MRVWNAAIWAGLGLVVLVSFWSIDTATNAQDAERQGEARSIPDRQTVTVDELDQVRAIKRTNFDLVNLWLEEGKHEAVVAAFDEADDGEKWLRWYAKHVLDDYPEFREYVDEYHVAFSDIVGEVQDAEADIEEELRRVSALDPDSDWKELVTLFEDPKVEFVIRSKSLARIVEAGDTKNRNEYLQELIEAGRPQPIKDDEAPSLRQVVDCHKLWNFTTHCLWGLFHEEDWCKEGFKELCDTETAGFESILPTIAGNADQVADDWLDELSSDRALDTVDAARALRSTRYGTDSEE